MRSGRASGKRRRRRAFQTLRALLLPSFAMRGAEARLGQSDTS
jgi:hypothetical protein